MKKYFIDMLKCAIENSGISLRELARQTDLDVSFLSKVLSGKRNPPSSEKDINKIARVLQMNSDRLMFSAGRIPKKFLELFNDDRFIKTLQQWRRDPQVKLDVPIRGVDKKTRISKRSIRTIEDELL
ncbi:helix-turn-helix domain-containing protein [Elusimicrobiota bacterium]